MTKQSFNRDELKKRLTPEQYNVLVNNATGARLAANCCIMTPKATMSVRYAVRCYLPAIPNSTPAPAGPVFLTLLIMAPFN